MLASVIFPLGDNPTLAALLSILHIDVTRQHIIAQLDKYGYKDLSALIQAVPEDEKLADSGPLNPQMKTAMKSQFRILILLSFGM